MFLESKDRIEFFFNDYLFDDLTVINFGHERCLANHSFGPQVRDYHVLHYVMKGKGTFKTNETTYSLDPGCFFLITPGDSAPIYQADHIDPWEYVWFGLEGKGVVRVMEKLGYSSINHVGKLNKHLQLNHKINEFITSNFLSQANSLQIQSYLMFLLSHLNIDGANLSLNQNISQTQKYVEQFSFQIRQNYWKSELSIQQIADNIGINNSYLSKLISKEFRQTPIEYLIRYRMTKAQFLIANTDHTVAAISKVVGYSNPLSFSRAYKRIYGYSPRMTPQNIRIF